MTRGPVVVDVGVAAALAIVLVAVEPGVAVGLVLAALLLALCAVTLLLDRWRARRSPRRQRTSAGPLRCRRDRQRQERRRDGSSERAQ